MYRIPRFFIKRHLFAAFLALAASGARADSGDVVFGETFDTEDDFARWTLVDNNAGRTWEFLNGAAAYMLDYQTGLPGDDWCISPEFHLSAGRVYELKFYLGINSMPENLKVFLGTSSEPSTFTKELADYNNVTSSDSGTKTLKIYVNADGNYRLGFYAYSQPNMHRIDIDNVSVTDIASAGVPGAVAGLTVVPAELGGMSADLSFVAPDVTATDETLTANVDINIYRNGGEEPVKTYKDVKPGTPLTWKDTEPAHGFNRGGNTAAGYKVDFVCDGEVVATADGADVEPANTVNVTYKAKATPADAVADSHEWQAIVKYDADEFDGNNASETLSTSVRRSDLPVVDGLSATGTPGNASLTWNAAASIPAVEHGEMQTVTDDFEDYEPFIIDNIGLWNVYDADKSTTMVSPRIPNSYEHQGEPMAFQVFNIEQAGVWVDGNMDDAFMPVNDASSQMLVCPSVDWPAENDDWLITPRLDGRQQTISFYAKAATYDSEWINVYYSTTDKHHDSFVKLNEDDHIAVSDGWRKYTYTVPEGARYFAVRCVRRVVMLMIDDFTYAPYDGSQEAAELLGYNVYRDNVKINTELVTTNKFTDTEAGHSEAVYTVTAVYDSGESAYSNEAVLTTTGISRPDADATTTESARYAIDGRRLDAPERGVNIVRMTDGKVRKVIVR